MAEECARCGTSDVHVERSVYPKWTGYLVVERGISRPIGSYRLPACIDCSKHVDMIRDSGDRYGFYDADEGNICSEYREFLDEIDLRLLIDDQLGDARNLDEN